MVRITENAAFALRELLSAYEGRASAALRIVVRPAANGESGLMLSLSGPRRSDLVVTERGLRVFVEPGAAARLDGKLLDARIERDRVRFLVAPYPQTR